MPASSRKTALADVSRSAEASPGASVTALDVGRAGRVVLVFGEPPERASALVKRIAATFSAGEVIVARAGDLPALEDGASHREQMERWVSHVRRQAPAILIDASGDEGLAAAWAGAADTVLVVCRATEPISAATHRVAEAAHRAQARLEFVLEHPRFRSHPSGTTHWLRALQPDAHHHVRDGRPADDARLARSLTGRAVALVLGSGGARGFAHIGVWRALAEAHQPIDFVGGASMGSVIAAQIALGWDPHVAVHRTREMFLSKGGIFDWRIPAVSLLRGDRLTSRVRRAFGEDTDVEDLWLPWFCVTSNLTQARPVTHTRGRLWKLICASGSIPGMAPPVEIDGELHVDGGMTALLPVEEARALGVGTIIAVNVMPHDASRAPSRLPKEHGVKTLWRRHALRDRRIPDVIDVVRRSLMLSIAHRGQVSAAAADICIEPAVSHFAILDPRPIERIVEAGYAAGLAALKDLPAQVATA